MNIPRRILVGTDFSDYSKEALDYAVLMAKHFGADLYLVHAFEEPVYIPGVTSLTGPETLEWVHTFREAARKKLEALAGEVRQQGIPVRSTLREGAPFREIPKAAEEVQADLIVLGTHGRTGLDRLMMGSVAERVAHRASCHVFLVKPKAFRRGSDRDVPEEGAA